MIEVIQVTVGPAFAQDAGVAMHRDQLAVDVSTVRRLIDQQFPPWRQLPIVEVSTAGTVNAIFRIGSQLAARFPLLAQNPADAFDLLSSEAAAARELAEI